jgi:hypothetical protein
MTADDFGTLDQQLAQRWGIETQLASSIVMAAQHYPNCF